MKNVIKRNSALIYSVLVLMVCSVVGISTAYLMRINVDGGLFKTTGTANNEKPQNVDFSGKNLQLVIYNAYPVEDKVGLQNEGYTFTVKSTETSKQVKYAVFLETQSKLENALSDSLVKYSVLNNATNGLTLSEQEKVLPTLDHFDSSYLIAQGTLNPVTNGVIDEHEYTLHLWINENATTANALNKNWSGKLVVGFSYIN